ncbi:hypothetical protein [Solemya velesiana gill symbiont]|nr:hypothetical protein [Solemya velesiana gill symbiont]
MRLRGWRPILMVLLLGLLSSQVYAQPRVPCGEAPVPSYGGPGEHPNIGIWFNESGGKRWFPPECTGWEQTESAPLVATAGPGVFITGREWKSC